MMDPGKRKEDLVENSIIVIPSDAPNDINQVRMNSGEFINYSRSPSNIHWQNGSECSSFESCKMRQSIKNSVKNWKTTISSPSDVSHLQINYESADNRSVTRSNILARRKFEAESCANEKLLIIFKSFESCWVFVSAKQRAAAITLNLFTFIDFSRRRSEAVKIVE